MAHVSQLQHFLDEMDLTVELHQMFVADNGELRPGLCSRDRRQVGARLLVCLSRRVATLSAVKLSIWHWAYAGCVAIG